MYNNQDHIYGKVINNESEYGFYQLEEGEVAVRFISHMNDHDKIVAAKPDSLTLVDKDEIIEFLFFRISKMQEILEEMSDIREKLDEVRSHLGIGNW